MRRAGTAAPPERGQRGGRRPVPRRRDRLPRHPPSLPIGARPSSVRPPAHPRRALARRRLGPAGGRPLENLIFAWNILKAALGLGFVIFIHELGHFLLAKWNGVKVLRFSIGFGPPIISYRKGVGLRVGAGSRPPGPTGDPPGWGETEYWLAYIPLGGYVKMLGENRRGIDRPSPARGLEPTPGLQEQVGLGPDADHHGRGDHERDPRPGLASPSPTPRAVTEIPAKLGGVLPGSPPTRPGSWPATRSSPSTADEMSAFKDLLNRVNLSAAGQKLKFTVQRPGVRGRAGLRDRAAPRTPPNPAPTIGILMATRAS